VSRALFVLAFGLALVAPGVAEACSVCFSTTEQNQWAFIGTTVFLSALPVGILFALGLWLRRRVLEMDAHRESTRRD